MKITVQYHAIVYPLSGGSITNLWFSSNSLSDQADPKQAQKFDHWVKAVEKEWKSRGSFLHEYNHCMIFLELFDIMKVSYKTDLRRE